MSNQVTINNKKLPLRFDFNALAEFEKLTGHNAFELGKFKFGATETIALCYVGLKCANEDLEMSLKDVGKALKINSFEDVMTAYVHDMEDLIGEQEEGK